MSPGKHFACRIFSTEASCPFRAGCLFILSLSFCPNITNPLRLLYKANAAAGKHLPFSFYKVAAPSMLTPALPKAAYKLRCIFPFPLLSCLKPFSCLLRFLKSDPFCLFFSVLCRYAWKIKRACKVCTPFVFYFTAKRFRQNIPTQCRTPQRH